MDCYSWKFTFKTGESGVWYQRIHGSSKTKVVLKIYTVLKDLACGMYAHFILLFFSFLFFFHPGLQIEP